MVWKPCVFFKTPTWTKWSRPLTKIFLKTGLSFHQLLVIFPAKKSTSCCWDSELPSAVAPLLLPGAVRARGRTAQRASHLQVKTGGGKKTGKTAAFANSEGGSHQKLSIQKKLWKVSCGSYMILKKKEVLFWSARRSWKFLPLWGDVQHVKKMGMSSHFRNISISTPYCCSFRNPACTTGDVWKPCIYWKKKTAIKILQTSTAWSPRISEPSNTTILSGFGSQFLRLKKLRRPKISWKHRNSRKASWRAVWIHPKGMEVGNLDFIEPEP